MHQVIHYENMIHLWNETCDIAIVFLHYEYINNVHQNADALAFAQRYFGINKQIGI